MSFLLDFDCGWSCMPTVLLALVNILAVFKIYMICTTGEFKGYQRLDGKTVIVTGANTGIGKETARDLAQRGARVILACRDLEKGRKAKGDIVSKTGNTNVVVKQLDLSSLGSVHDFARDILDSEPRIDVLINNAGAGWLGNSLTEDGLQMGMQVNHFGPFLLTNLLVDLVQKSYPSRIIFVSSVLHKFAKLDVDNLNFTKYFSDIQVYNYSKLANILTANELARKLKGTGVTVNSLHPGAVFTEFTRNMPNWLLPMANGFTKYFFKTAKQGAQTTIYLAVSDEVQGVTGKYFADCKEAKMSALAADEGLAKTVWEKSEEFVRRKRR